MRVDVGGPITTTNARNTMCGRPGKGVPDSVVIGTANAAASDTTPRMPAQATTNTSAGGGFGSPSRLPANRARGTYVNT